MNKAYNANGVETPEFRKDNAASHTAVRKAVDHLMSLGYSGQDVSYHLCGNIQLAVASNNIHNAFKRKKEEK
jgi:hypothetical protein|tara:strand:- start:1599 stop:1814 length:216 start_codon:yes stop_codon:yes gene_type:complete